MPWMRQQLVSTVAGFSDPDFHRPSWLHQEFPPEVEFDTFDDAVMVLFDILELEESPDWSLGRFVRSREGEKLKVLIQRLNLALDGVGPHAPTDEYLDSSLWPDVVDAAREALAALTATEDGDAAR